MASELTHQILKILDIQDETDTFKLAEELQQDHQKIIGAVKSLQSLGNLIEGIQKVVAHWELTKEGKEVVEKGSPEVLIFNAIPNDGIEQSKLMTLIPNGPIGFSKAMSNKWILIDASLGKPLIKRKVENVTDNVRIHLTEISKKNDNSVPDKLKQEYKKRKLLQEVVLKGMTIKKGSEFTLSIAKQETDLTVDLLAGDSWKQKSFKDYNFDALGVPPNCGSLHPLMKVRAEFRKIFLEMGFQEMPTNNFVESSFWNFDALFQPQQHPARDAHDTFFLSYPAQSANFPKDYMEKVKKIHSSGGFGSSGYQYDWKIEEASKNLLRTHTTAVSARMLYKVAQEKEFKPCKFFSIDRVFRNETLDSTHLAEFHQVEGLIADYNLSLGDLIGVLYAFFQKLGISKLKFKPAYNPYTEPSMEIFSHHSGLNKWIEIGNSGMFRPEMLLPMGLPPDVNVIAWGLSLERPTMIKYKLNNIRDLVGPKVDLQMVQSSPLCRLDK